MKELSALLVFLSASLALAQQTEVAPGVLHLGTLQNPSITESSGVSASRRFRGAYWTHNDGGDPRLYGFSSNGTASGEWTVENLKLRDWEDIAVSGSRIYIADVGNNHGDPGDVYAVEEPDPRQSGILRVLNHWVLNYPGSPFDAESFFISRGYGYLIEKGLGNSHVYRFKLAGRSAGVLEKQCLLNTDSPVTGGDITSDNRRLAVITDSGAYLFLLPARVPSSGMLQPALFVPYALAGMEGCAFTRDGLIVTAETGDILLFTDPLFRIRR